MDYDFPFTRIKQVKKQLDAMSGAAEEEEEKKTEEIKEEDEEEKKEEELQTPGEAMLK